MNTFHHTSLQATDPERSRTFYEALGFTFAGSLGITKEDGREYEERQGEPGPVRHYFFTDGRGQRVLELSGGNGEQSWPYESHFGLVVDDLDATIARLEATDFEIEIPPYKPMNAGEAVVAFARDPDGYLIELIWVPSSN
jgi:catechol 2,3-dioxygenase-like lactoylglutathione lyase family enzyme